MGDSGLSRFWQYQFYQCLNPCLDQKPSNNRAGANVCGLCSPKDKLYVGDRKANVEHIVNLNTQTKESNISVGQGVIHMWARGNGKQLWVSNDVDNTISIIDLDQN